MANIESIRLEGEEAPPIAIKNFLITYDSPLYGEEVNSPIFSTEPIFLSGDDGEEYLLLGEDEETGYLVYGFEDDFGQAMLVYGDDDGNIHEVETLEGFKFGGFKGFKMKAPKFKMRAPKIRAPKIKTSGLTKSFSSVGKGLSSGVKAYGKAWSGVGKGLGKGFSSLTKGLGKGLSSLAEGAGSLLSPGDEAPQEEEEEEEEPAYEELNDEQQNEEFQTDDETQNEDYQTNDEIKYTTRNEGLMGNELGFAQFIPMGLSAASSLSQGAQAKKIAKSTAKNKRNDALLKAITESRKPIKVRKPTATRPGSIRVSKPTGPGVKSRGDSKGGLDFDVGVKDDTKTFLIIGGIGVVGAMLLLGKKSRK